MVGSTISDPASSIASGIMACVTRASTAPPATASENTVTSGYEPPISPLPAAAASVPKRLALAQAGDGLVTLQNIDFAAGDDIEGVAGIAGVEEDLPGLQPAGAHRG